MATIIGITGDADQHCLSCAIEAYGIAAVETACNPQGPSTDDPAYPRDREGNPLGVIFASDELLEGSRDCTMCGDPLDW